MKNRTGLFLASLLSITIIASTHPVLSFGQSKNVRTDQLAGQSDVIVVGKVNSLKSQWNADKSRIQTSVSIAVDEAIKGAVEGNTLTVVIPGGEVDGVGEWYSHSVSFKAEEEVVVFAAKDKSGRYRVTSGERGKFLVGKDAKTGSKIIRNVGSLSDFTTQIRKNIKDQQSLKKED